MQKLLLTLVSWLPLAIAITGLCLLPYVLVQQNYRQTMNDPQIEMARDAAEKVARGAALESVIPPGLVMMESSLSPWIAVLDTDGRPLVEFEKRADGTIGDVSFIASSGLLNGDLYQIPAGIFEFASLYGESRLTWQSDSTRQALVVVPIQESNYFVVAGRNTSETHMRIQEVGQTTLVIWLTLLLSTFAAKYLSAHVARRRHAYIHK